MFKNPQVTPQNRLVSEHPLLSINKNLKLIGAKWNKLNTQNLYLFEKLERNRVCKILSDKTR
jgi:hypothetical protein